MQLTGVAVAAPSAVVLSSRVLTAFWSPSIRVMDLLRSVMTASTCTCTPALLSAGHAVPHGDIVRCIKTCRLATRLSTALACTLLVVGDASNPHAATACVEPRHAGASQARRVLYLLTSKLLAAPAHDLTNEDTGGEGPQSQLFFVSHEQYASLAWSMSGWQH